MRVLLLLSILLHISNCRAMEQASEKVLDNDGAVKKFLKAVKCNDCLTADRMATESPDLIQSSRIKKCFYKEPVSALHIAAAYGCNACIKVLLAHKADPNIATGVKKNTPLHYVQTIKGARLLLDAGAYADQENIFRRTPICSALFFKEMAINNKTNAVSESIAQLLFDAGACIDHEDTGQNSLLHIAVHRNCVHVVDFLLRNNACTEGHNCFGLTPFDIAIKVQQDKNVLQVFEKYGMFFFPEMTPMELFRAPFYTLGVGSEGIAFLNNWARVFAFVRNKKPNDKHYPTHHGVICNQYGCIIKDISWKDLEQFFTPSGAGIIENAIIAQHNEALSLVRANEYQALQRKIERFPFIMANQDRLLVSMITEAIQKKHVNSLRILLSHKNEDKVINGEMFLHLAVFYDSPQAIKLLINHNADCLMKNAQNKTPMGYAIEIKREDCIKKLNALITELFLISLWADDYKRSKQLLKEIVDCNVLREGNALLHRMMVSLNAKTEKFIDLLVRQGANPNLFNEMGDSPLWALMGMEKVRVGIFEALLHAGARVNMRCSTSCSMSLLQVAMLREDFALAALFLKYGAFVTQDLLNNKEVPTELSISLQQKYNEQECCICCEQPERLRNIPCVSGHTESICFSCYGGTNKKCPLCRQQLNGFGW